MTDLVEASMVADTLDEHWPHAATLEKNTLYKWGACGDRV